MHSKEFFNYSTFSLSSSFDLVKDDPTIYNIGYKDFNLDIIFSFISNKYRDIVEQIMESI